VVWHGFAAGEIKHELFSQSDVFLQLSECRENAPLGVIEAKHYGLYVVGTQIGGIPEQIENRDAGLLIPVADPEALGCVLQALAKTRQELRSGREARARRSAGYGTREMAGEYLRVFRLGSPDETSGSHNR
jgi:glycosyltransferase involved in cell wall biosynthesis